MFVKTILSGALLVGALTVNVAIAQSGGFESEEPGLYAEVDVSWRSGGVPQSGFFVIELLYDSAPVTVSNFIGLATGQQAWRDPESLKIESGAYYNDLTFHRVRPMRDELDLSDSGLSGLIVGGDIAGTGAGGPGYVFHDEIDWSLTHEGPGVVSMQNTGPNSNGSLFFITTTNPGYYPSHLDGSHSIFGQVVAGQGIVDALSIVARNDDDQPLEEIVFNIAEFLVVGPEAEIFVSELDSWRPQVSFEAVDTLNIRKAGGGLQLKWDGLIDCDYVVYQSTDLDHYETISVFPRTAIFDYGGLLDLGPIEEQASSSAFFTLYGSLHPSLSDLAAKRLEMTLSSLWGSNNPVVLNFGMNGQGSYSIGGDEPARVKHVQASLLDHQQPAYSAQVDAASRSRSWAVWSKPAESGGGNMTLSGLSNEVATFEAPAGARAYITSVGAVKNGHTYVFSLNVDSSSGSGAITLAKLNGINHFTGASSITIGGGNSGRYAMKFTATADDPSVHFRVGIGVAGPISAEQTVVLSQPMLQDVTESDGRFDDWIEFPKATWELPGNTIDGGANSGRVVPGIGEEMEDSSHPFAMGFGIGDSFANNSGDWVNVLGRSVEGRWQGRFLGKGQPGGTLTHNISPNFDYYYDLLDAGYDYAVLQGGVNDVNSSTITLSNIQDAVRAMVDQVRAKGIDMIFICNIAPWSASTAWSPSEQVETENYNSWLAAYCATESLRLIDTYAALADPTAPAQLSDGSGTKPNYDSGDGLHPNPEGHQVIADQIIESMALRFGEIEKYSWLPSSDDIVQLHVWTDSDQREVQYYLDFTSEFSGVLNARICQYYTDVDGELVLISDRPYSSTGGVFLLHGGRP